MSKIYIVGNGPSRANHSWSDGISIGCNLTEDTNSVVVTDARIAGEILLGKQRITRPVILGPQAYRYVESNRGVTRKISLIGAVPPRDKQDTIDRDPQNAGQTAVLWALRVGFSDIRLIGFDSLWTGSRETLTEKHYPQSEKYYRNNIDNKAPAEKWAKGWHAVFKEFPEAKLQVYCPEWAVLPYKRMIAKSVPRE
jgi:hypothetical protein